MTSHVHAIDIMPRRNAGNVKIPSFSMTPITSTAIAAIML
jgi:hypothetical protein